MDSHTLHGEDCTKAKRTIAQDVKTRQRKREGNARSTQSRRIKRARERLNGRKKD